jgi:hypothetical protein
MEGHYTICQHSTHFLNGQPNIIFFLSQYTPDVQNYWAFRLCPSSNIIKSRKHNISEIGSVSVLGEGEMPAVLGLLERANLNHLRMESDPVSKTLCFLAFRVPDNG